MPLMKASNRIIVLMLFFAASLHASTFFVRSGGTGNGTSWASAWANTSNITWSSVTPGSTVCIAGGSYGALNLGASGTSSAPILVKRASSSDPVCGSTSAGWNASYDAQVVLSSIGLAGNYVTVDGMVANGMTVTVPNTSATSAGIAVGGATNSLTLRHIEVAGPCGNTPCMHNGDDRSMQLNSWNGSGYDAQQNMTLQYMNLHGACNLMWISNGQNMVIEHSRFADSATTSSTYCHPNVIATQSSTNMTFRYNEVTNWQVEGIMHCPSGACTSTWEIYGNLWHDPMTSSYPRVNEVQYGSTGPIHIYNNTFVGIFYAVETAANGGSYASGSTDRNNIYWNSVAPGLSDHDYDLSNGSLSETHSQVLSSSPFKSISGQDYHLTVNTGAGLNLGTTYATDYDGNARATWSRGAFEYNGSATATAPNPPSALSAIVQ